MTDPTPNTDYVRCENNRILGDHPADYEVYQEMGGGHVRRYLCEHHAKLYSPSSRTRLTNRPVGGGDR